MLPNKDKKLTSRVFSDSHNRQSASASSCAPFFNKVIARSKVFLGLFSSTDVCPLINLMLAKSDR